MARYNGRGESGDPERQALLSDGIENSTSVKNPNRGRPTSSTAVQYVNTNIDTHRADLPLIVSFFISGMIDAGAYNAYECFTSMQTGNTIFAALGVSNLPVSSPRLAWVKSLVSILSFLLGSVLLTHLQRYLGQTKRWVLSLSFLFQALLIGISAELVRQGKSSGSPVGGDEGKLYTVPEDPGFPWTDLLPIAFLSFQASGKVVASQVTGQTAIPVVVLTTLYNTLISDPGLFTGGLTGNVPRNRKFGGLVFYFGGATVGGVAASGQLGFSGGLAVACAIQVAVAVLWLAIPGQKDDEAR